MFKAPMSDLTLLLQLGAAEASIILDKSAPVAKKKPERNGQGNVKMQEKEKEQGV